MTMSIFSIVLAAGTGTRMGSAERHKVCFEIDGRPAIARLLTTCSACGVGSHIVVVGDKAQQVMATVARTGEPTIFAYQPEQRGTGHAARQGARVLQELGYEGPVLVVPGDKVVEPSALRKLIAHFVGAGLCARPLDLASSWDRAKTSPPQGGSCAMRQGWCWPTSSWRI